MMILQNISDLSELWLNDGVHLCVISGALWEDYRHRVKADWVCGFQEELSPESDSPLFSWDFPAHGMEQQGIL